MNQMSKREHWANTEEEKIIFFEDWTPDTLLKIARLRRNKELAGIHEYAIEPNMAKLLNSIMEHLLHSKHQ